jgi:hypothetical protein
VPGNPARQLFLLRPAKQDDAKGKLFLDSVRQQSEFLFTPSLEWLIISGACMNPDQKICGVYAE